MTYSTGEIGKHLEEIRKRVLRTAIAVGAITVFLITFHAEPFDFFGVTLYYPIPEPLNNIAAQITDYMRNNIPCRTKFDFFASYACIIHS